MSQLPGRDAPPNMTDYEAERASFRLAVPRRFNYVADVLERWAQREPDALALLSLDAGGEVAARHTVAQLCAEAHRMAHTLTALGIRRGDPVFVMLPRIPEWYVAVLGAIRIGAVPLPATTMLSADDVRYRIAQAQAVAAVTDGPGAAKIDQVRDELPSVALSIVAGEPPSGSWQRMEDLLAKASTAAPPPDPTAADDPMLVYFTSGTVAYPKMVMHTQASYGLGHLITARYWQDLRPGDMHWTVSDTGWAKAAWGKLFGQWAVGATVVQMNMGKPDPGLLLATLARHRVTTFCAPPTLYRMLVLGDLRAHDLAGLRHCVSAGEPLNPEVIRVWNEGTGLTVYDGYGQTETVNLVANYRCMPVRPGSMGKPTPGFDVAVVDEGGDPVADGDLGQVAVHVKPRRPVGLFTEYWRDPDATAGAFQADWYLTGDTARRDEDGYFWFESRADDVIISAAYRIGPFEVESALVAHAAVAEAAVVGRPDPERTERVVAFVTLAPGHEPTAALASRLQDHVKRTTAPYKYPREVHFVEELPKTVSGKIRRTELRARLRAELDH